MRRAETTGRAFSGSVPAWRSPARGSSSRRAAAGSARRSRSTSPAGAPTSRSPTARGPMTRRRSSRRSQARAERLRRPGRPRAADDAHRPCVRRPTRWAGSTASCTAASGGFAPKPLAELTEEEIEDGDRRDPARRAVRGPGRGRAPRGRRRDRVHRRPGRRCAAGPRSWPTPRPRAACGRSPRAWRARSRRGCASRSCTPAPCCRRRARRPTSSRRATGGRCCAVRVAGRRGPGDPLPAGGAVRDRRGAHRRRRAVDSVSDLTQGDRASESAAAVPCVPPSWRSSSCCPPTLRLHSHHRGDRAQRRPAPDGDRPGRPDAFSELWGRFARPALTARRASWTTGGRGGRHPGGVRDDLAERAGTTARAASRRLDLHDRPQRGARRAAAPACDADGRGAGGARRRPGPIHRRSPRSASTPSTCTRRSWSCPSARAR